MPTELPNDNPNPPEATDEEVSAIVGESLPHWKLACERDGLDTVVLHQREFGRSMRDIFLLHAAIRYAGIHGKKVLIYP